jgi:hypothetical protein
MKITKIENEGNIFKVTKSPNLLQRIFGLKTKVENYIVANGKINFVKINK